MLKAGHQYTHSDHGPCPPPDIIGMMQELDVEFVLEVLLEEEPSLPGEDWKSEVLQVLLHNASSPGLFNKLSLMKETVHTSLRNAKACVSHEPLLKEYVLLSLSQYFLLRWKGESLDMPDAWDRLFRPLDEALIVAGGGEWKWWIDLTLEGACPIHQGFPGPDQNWITKDLFTANMEIRRVNHEMLLGRSTLPGSLQIIPSSQVGTDTDRWVQDKNSPMFYPSLVNTMDHPWNRVSYWRRFDPRTVPVEHGVSYTDPDWEVILMSFSNFLDHLLEPSMATPRGPYYLAQHDLFLQIPSLLKDLSPTLASLLQSDGILRRIWFGPAHTFTPFHTDPYYNLFTQVVGFKRVLLLSPLYTSHMQPHDPSSLLKNTSTLTEERLGHLSAHIIEVILGPFDVLSLPPGWWHSVTSLTTSISISAWHPPDPKT